MADHRGTLEDRLRLHVETESQIDAENNIEWRWVVQDSVDRCVAMITDNELSSLGLHRTFRINWRIPEISLACRFVQSYNVQAHTFSVRDRVETLSLAMIREAFSLPEGVHTVPNSVKHERFASWFSHYDSVGKKIFVHTGTRQNWVPIIQVINIILLARPRPQELHGKLALTLVSKVDGEPALHYDWATLVLSDEHLAIEEEHLAIEEDGRHDGNEDPIPQITDRESPVADSIAVDDTGQSDHNDQTDNHVSEGYPNIDEDHGGDFEQDADQDDDADYEGAHRQNNVGRDVEEDSGALPNADYDTRTSPSRRRPVTAEDVADLECRRDQIWWDVDLLETRKMRMEMEMEDLEGAFARAESSLQAAIRKVQQVEKDLNNKMRRKEEVEREIAEKEQFWERYLRTIKVQVEGQKQYLNFLTKEVEQAKRESANIPRFSTGSGHLDIQDSDLASEPVDADRYNSLLIHARQVEALLKTFREGYLDPHVEFNRSNHDSAQGECSSRPGLFDGLLAAVQEAMESLEEENSLGSLLAAIEQEAEHTNSPFRQGQEVPVHSDVLQPERIPQTFSCGDQQLPVDNEDPRPERIPPEVSSHENDPPATSNANSPRNPQPPLESIGCLPNEQTAEVITVESVPVTSNTSPQSLHGGPTAQEDDENTRKDKRKAETAALVGFSSPSKRVATVPRPPQITFVSLRSQHSPTTQRRPPFLPTSTSRGTVLNS
ncbi:hypothetical protein R1sor_009935 [Riccia sorocarpa]|uniref:Uncharacterized protein n=1 Tax=Riccia sorocarpa TaxID=122646 RepID=A0ABD3HYI6_9MARC